MSPPKTLEIRDRKLANGGWLIVLTGDLTNRTRAAASDRLETVLSATQRLVVDLSELDSISGAGVRLLLTAAHKASSAGGRMIVHSPSPSVQGMLELTGLASVVSVCGSREAAVARLA